MHINNGSMSFIGDFLEKFKKIHQDSFNKKQGLLDIVNSVTQLSFTSADISVKNGILSIKASPAQKTELYMKKDKLLQALSSHKIIAIR